MSRHKADPDICSGNPDAAADTVPLGQGELLCAGADGTKERAGEVR